MRDEVSGADIRIRWRLTLRRIRDLTCALLVGNTALYGATGGSFFANGRVLCPLLCNMALHSLELGLLDTRTASNYDGLLRRCTCLRWGARY